MPQPSVPAGQAMNHEYPTVLSGTLVSAPANGDDQQNPCFRGVKVVVDVTAFAGTSITFTIQGKDPSSGKYYTLLATAALAATGTLALTVYPGVTAAANVSASDVVPRKWRVISTGTFNNTTFTIGAVGIV